MISLTMSRISSRAAAAVELGELRQIDGVDQRVEDGRLDVVVLFRMPALRAATGSGAGRARAPRSARGLASAALRGAAGAASCAGSARARGGGIVRTPAEHGAATPQRLSFSFSRSGANGASGEAFFSSFMLLAVRQRQRHVAELLGRLGLGGELLDHLAVVGGQAERLAVELDHLRRR